MQSAFHVQYLGIRDPLHLWYNFHSVGGVGEQSPSFMVWELPNVKLHCQACASLQARLHTTQPANLLQFSGSPALSPSFNAPPPPHKILTNKQTVHQSHNTMTNEFNGAVPSAQPLSPIDRVYSGAA